MEMGFPIKHVPIPTMPMAMKYNISTKLEIVNIERFHPAQFLKVAITLPGVQFAALAVSCTVIDMSRFSCSHTPGYLYR